MNKLSILVISLLSLNAYAGTDYINIVVGQSQNVASKNTGEEYEYVYTYENVPTKNINRDNKHKNKTQYKNTAIKEDIYKSNDFSDSSMYSGIGVASISGSSESDKFNDIVSPIMVLGKKLGNNFSIEIATTVGENSNSNYILEYHRSFSVLAHMQLFDRISVLGKVSLNHLKLNRSNLTHLESVDVNPGLGLRYEINNDIFIDSFYEGVSNKVIDGRTEDISQVSISLKSNF
jgi:hypothetical protein